MCVAFCIFLADFLSDFLSIFLSLYNITPYLETHARKPWFPQQDSSSISSYPPSTLVLLAM